MSNTPVAGKNYTIERGDTLWGIATIVYGSGRKYTIIWDANRSNLRSGDPNKVYPGEVIFIPVDQDSPASQIAAQRVYQNGAQNSGDGNGPNEINLEIDGSDVKTGSISVLLTLDTPADGWSATARHTGKDDHTYSLFRPYQYPLSRVHVGNTFVGESLLYNVEPSWTPDSTMVGLEGFCQTVDFIDSATDGPYQSKNITFEDWLRKKVAPFGIPVEMDVSSDEKYRKVKMDKNESAYAHFDKLAKERAYLIGNTERGGLKVFDAIEDGPVVAKFAEGSDRPMHTGSARFSGRDRFRRVKGRGSGPRKNISETIVDEFINRERMKSLTVNNTVESTIRDAVRAARNKTLEDALTFQIPIFDWYNDYYELFRPGQFVTVQSDRAYLEQPFKFIIRDARFSRGGERRTGSLTVVPPTVYTKGELVDPWNTAL